jgi:hypothetical protein
MPAFLSPWVKSIKLIPLPPSSLGIAQQAFFFILPGVRLDLVGFAFPQDSFKTSL